jgi:hypothetical protein
MGKESGNSYSSVEYICFPSELENGNRIPKEMRI